MVKKVLFFLYIAASTISFVLINPLSSYSQISQAESTARLEVAPRSGTLDDILVFSVVIENPQERDIPVHLIGGDDFKLSLIGSQSSSKIINGQHSRQLIYNYRLIPKRSGELQTPGAEVTIANQRQVLSPLTVTIAKGQQPPSTKQHDIMVVQQSDKKDVYLGEQINLTLELLTSKQLHDARFGDLSFEGFWVEELGQNEHGRRVIDGKQYDTVRLNRVLFPLSSGPQTLAKKELFVKVEKQRQLSRGPMDPLDPWNDGLFDRFFGQIELEELTIRSNALKINVKELPPLPNNFPDWGGSTTLVGDTTIALSYDSNTIRVGDSKTIEVKISTRGNLRPLREVPLNTPSSLRAYQERPEIRMVEHQGALLSTSSWRISLVPHEPGLVKIPPIRIGFFNPVSGRYQIAKTEEITFSVEGESNQDSSVSTATPATDTSRVLPEKELQTGDQYREETELERLSSQISLSLALLLIFGVSFVTYLLLKIIKFLNIRRRKQSTIRALETSSSLDQLASAFRKLLIERLKLTDRNANNEQLKAATNNKVTDTNLRFALLTILDELDLMLYGGKVPTPSEVEALKKRILQLGKEWR